MSFTLKHFFQVATLSWDDKLRLFDTSVMKGQMTGNAVKHNNNTGRWLTPFKVMIFFLLRNKATL